MTITKFNIENTFSTGKEGYDPEREAFEQQIELVRSQAHKAGFQEGHEQALSEIESKTQEALNHLQTSLTTLYDERITIEKNIELQSVQLAHLIAKKLAASLIEKYPSEEIDKLLLESLKAGYKEPKIIIKVSMELLQSITEKMQEMVKVSGFLGEVQILGDESFTIFDCSAEWPNGGISRNIATLEKQIQAKVERYINGPLDDVAVQNIEENLAQDDEEPEAEEEFEVEAELEQQESAEENFDEAIETEAEAIETEAEAIETEVTEEDQE